MNEPYLIQRVLRHLFPRKEAVGVDAVFEFDYMGSAEFEFGAKGNALRAMRAALGKNKNAFVVEEVRPLTAHAPIWYVGPKDRLGAVCLWLNKHLAGKTDQKEQTYMEYVIGDKEPFGGPLSRPPVGWWILDDTPPWALFTNSELADTWLDALKTPLSIKKVT